MSYLDVPRICISGRFFTDPSTVDNDPAHYIDDDAPPSPWQTPDGKHEFKLTGCLVQSARDNTGANVADPALIGAPVVSLDFPIAAKLADLDVYQQGVSTVYGLQVTIRLTDGTNLVGAMDAASLNGAQFNVVLPKRSWAEYGSDGSASYGGDSFARGTFQSVLRVPEANWPATKSPVLAQLRAASAVVGGNVLLSIKFTLDGYINNPVDANCSTGRFIAAIGPGSAAEPPSAPGDRWLAASPAAAPGPKTPWFRPSFYSAPFKVNAARKVLTIDLSNSISTVEIGGSFVDLGTFNAVLGDPAGTVIGVVPFSQVVYTTGAGICELPLTDAQLEGLGQYPLKVSSSGALFGPLTPLSEDPSGLLLAGVDRVIRVPGAPGSTVTARVFASRRGVPASGLALGVTVVPVHGNTPGATVPPSNPGDTPQADDAVSASITPTDASGFATITVTVLKDPGARTPLLDGQLYFLYPYLGADPGIADVPQERLISCLAWSDSPVNPSPTFADVQALLKPYMKLFPAMKATIDLNDPTAFGLYASGPPFAAYGQPKLVVLDRITGGAIPFVLSRDPQADSRFMPVTRDLSPNRIKTILYYIQNQYFPAP